MPRRKRRAYVVPRAREWTRRPLAALWLGALTAFWRAVGKMEIAYRFVEGIDVPQIPNPMNPREDISGLSKSFAHRLSALIEARLVTYREFEPWTESLILQMPRPPRWILELTTTPYQPDAVRIVRAFAHSEPFEALSEAEWVDDYLAALYLRYERRELSWATLLQMAGDISDGYSGKRPCEFYYEMLNEYERSDFAPSVESKQLRVFLSHEQSAIASVRNTFETITRFQRQGENTGDG